MLKIQKRLATTARETHVLLRELLVYALGWSLIDSSPGAGSFGLQSSGTDGETDSSTPTTFTAASGAFTVADVGRYLVLGGTSTPFGTRGVYKIVAVPNATTLKVTSGLYGASFSTALNVTWRVVDPTLNTDATFFVVEGPAGTSGPFWQARFYMNLADTTTIRADVGPFGGWSIGPGWTGAVTSAIAVNCDATPLWYILVQNENIILFTETVGGGSCFECAYIGTGTPRRPDIDDHFAVAVGGVMPLALTAIPSIAADDLTAVNYESLIYSGTLGPTANYFIGLPNSPFDLKRDLAEIALTCTAVGFEEDDRGTLRGVRYVSSLIPYRSFVDNGRTWVSLGNSIAVQWDGSVSA